MKQDNIETFFKLLAMWAIVYGWVKLFTIEW
jgi:hypothetical protein